MGRPVGFAFPSRGDRTGRPYGITDNDDPVHVIRHDDEFVQFNFLPIDFLPALRIFLIDGPLQGVIGDVRSDAPQVRVVADDVVVEAFLPAKVCNSSVPDMRCHRCFECSNDD